MEKLTMWKKTINKDYIGSWDLCIGADEKDKPIYKDMIVTIKDVKEELVTDMEKVKTNRNFKATKEELSKMELLVYFEELPKPMIIHAKSNFKGLEEATGTPFIERWIGKQVCVYVETGVKAFGTVTDALRIKPVPKRLCSVCGNIVSENTYNASMQKYGKSLCSKECLEKIGEK
jgi:hypothetical protein